MKSFWCNCKNPFLLFIGAAITLLAIAIGGFLISNPQKISSPQIAELNRNLLTKQGDVWLNQPILIDFYADWCMPCKMEAPIVEKASQEWQGKVQFMKVNVDKDNWKLARSLGISAIPTLVVMNPTDKHAYISTGFLTEAQLRVFIGKCLKVQKQSN